MTLLRICNCVDCRQWTATRSKSSKRSKAKKYSVTPTKPKRPNTLLYNYSK